MEYYAIKTEEFSQHRPGIAFSFVKTHGDLCRVVARELTDLIRARRARNQMAVVILPVGPLDYGAFAALCNAEGVSCESLVIFSMDEYAGPDGRAIPETHPLSFRAFYRANLLDRLDPDKRLPPDQLILPDPADPGATLAALARFGPADVTYGGMGINGHFAFNAPPAPGTSVEALRATSVRVVSLGDADLAQMALLGTGGNLELIPARACTLGMRELLAARAIHLTFMRSWHAGVLRRALFGPVTAAFPGSLVQTHPNVRVTITALAAQQPLLSILQQPGK